MLTAEEKARRRGIRLSMMSEHERAQYIGRAFDFGVDTIDLGHGDRLGISLVGVGVIEWIVRGSRNPKCDNT